jgi:hypothetical protein
VTWSSRRVVRGPWMGDSMAAEKPKADPDDTKKSKKDKWMNFFSLSNPDLWIALGVIALVVILVCSPGPPRARARKPAARECTCAYVCARAHGGG